MNQDDGSDSEPELVVQPRGHWDKSLGVREELASRFDLCRTPQYKFGPGIRTNGQKCGVPGMLRAYWRSKRNRCAF